MPVAAIRRREFLTLLGGAAAGCPLTGRAQQIGKLPTIGFLGPNARPAASEWVAALVQRLGELGWIEGRNITIAYRWAEGIDERFAEIAAEFVRLKVDVIVTSGTPAVMALRQATSVIPIVFATAGDPVGNNLVASLARPGANITGLATLAADLAGKRLEILREVVPGLGRLAIMGNAANPFTVLEMGEVKTAARTLGLEVAILEIRRAQDIAATLGPRGRALCLYRWIREHQQSPNQRGGAGCTSADDARVSGLRRSGRPHVLWPKFSRSIPTLCRLC
jgi:putative ABC transport system substrate-binding protein